MDKRVVLGGMIALLTFLYSGFLLSKSRTFQFFGGITNRVNTNQKVVALTFDDAPLSKSNEVLEILKQKQVRATFYVVGQNIERYPKEARAIVDAGMEIGNHSYSHKRFLFKSLAFIDSEVQKTNALIRDIGYEGEITFRPPNGKKLIGLPWYLKQHRIKTIMWDVEPDAYSSNFKEGSEKTDFLVNHTLENTKPGSIILIHPLCNSCESDRQALGQIIDGLQTQGYIFVTVSELLNL